MLAQQLGGLLGLGVGHAGDRLVDQQQLRVLRQQHADLEPLLLAVRERRRRAGRGARPGRSCSSISSMRVALARRCRASSSVGQDARGRLQRELAGCRRPCGSRTRSASGTCGRCRARRSPPRRAGQVDAAVEAAPRPSSGRVLPVMTSIIVRLAGAVRADDGAHLAGLDDERQVVQRRKPSKVTVTPSR